MGITLQKDEVKYEIYIDGICRYIVSSEELIYEAINTAMRNFPGKAVQVCLCEIKVHRTLKWRNDP